MKKKITLIVVAVLLVITLIVGVSYAYWRLSYTQTGINKLVSSCFSMELANEKNNITLDSAYPISDEKGKVLTPYSFTITNTCDLFASYTINLEMLEGTTLNSKYIKTMINNEAITNLNTLEETDTSIEGATESRILFKGSLGSGDSTDYTLRLWIDSDTPATDDTMNKLFQAKITVTAEVSTYSPVENGFTNLADALLVNEYQTTSLNVAKNKIASKQEVDFSKTAPIIIWKSTLATTTENISISKASPDVIGSYGVVNETTKIAYSNSYTFDSETGFYTLGTKTYYNPDELDFSSDHYYFCASSITASADDTVIYYDGTKCSTLYEISELVSVRESTLTLSSGIKMPINIYTFSVYSHKETEVESDKSDKGLYESIDDYGTTYYYRGNVTNNYVKFGNYYWRVIRVNGDGSVRLLYAGNHPNADGSEVVIASSHYNSIRTNPTYIGYMYSNTLNTSYEDTISNDNNSVIKTKLDNWYKTYFVDTGYTNYISDAGFCNDRSIASDSPGTGASANETTYYGPNERVVNKTPIFTCPNPKNDLFTLAGNTKGNQSLIYPVGVLTIDEIMFAGMTKGYLNKMSYIYSNTYIWTLSHSQYEKYQSAAIAWITYPTGEIGTYHVNGSLGIRPVINLKADTEITGGIGTKNDPFIVD